MGEGLSATPAVWLDLSLAAIGEQFGAVDEAGIVGGEEEGRLGDFLGFAYAAERDARGEIVEETLLLVLVVAGKLDEAGCAGGAGRSARHIVRTSA